MSRTMLMHALIRVTEDIFSTYIFPMAVYYAALIYNPVPDVNSGLSAIDIWSISRFDKFS